MARTADHNARRQQVTGAVRTLIPRVGFDGVTVAGVAKEAGISVGLVQHYFKSKDELLLSTYREVMRAARSRVDQILAEGESRRLTIRDGLFEGFVEALPLDSKRQDEYRVRQAFAARAIDRPMLAKVATEGVAKLRAEVAGAVENGKECGEVEPTLDSEMAALELLALLEGLAARAYHEPRAKLGSQTVRKAALAVLRSRLGLVFSGECRHFD